MATERALPPKSFAILGIVTLVAVLGAAFIIGIESADRSSDFERRALFPDLETQVNDVARITIESKDELFDVVRGPDGAWSLPSKGGYRPALSPLRLTIQGLASLEIIESKTARPEMHEAIGLKSPSDGGDAVLIGLYGDTDNVLARVLVGNVQSRGRGSTPSTYYVRLPEQDQTWLAQSILDVQAEQTDWIETSLFDVQRDDIQSVSVTPLEGPAYLLDRESNESPDFALGFVPEGRTPKAAFNLNTTAYAVAGLTIADVKPIAEVDFGDAARATYRLFNGLVLDLELIKVDEVYWISFVVDAVDPPLVVRTPDEGEAEEGVPAEPSREELLAQAQELATQINARTDGWTFGLAEFKFNQITKTLDSLLEPLEEETDTGETEPDPDSDSQ